MSDLHFSLLDQVNTTADLKKLSVEQLPAFCAQLRKFLIYSISNSSGHFASNLGTVELTVALHYVYDSPTDKIIWDVGHQAYAHKILTGRKNQIHNIRKFKGLHPFPFRRESQHDILTVGHSSTSLSVGAGISFANKKLNKQEDIIAVIGDGALTAGMVFEALNHAGGANLPMTIVYNDNNMSISNNKGILSKYANEFIKSNAYQKLRSFTKNVFSDINPLKNLLKATENTVKQLYAPKIAEVFEVLGVEYVVTVDGHDVIALVELFKKIKGSNKLQVVHAITKKGKGYLPAEQDPIKWHGVGNFKPEDHLFSCADEDSEQCNTSKEFAPSTSVQSTESTQVISNQDTNTVEQSLSKDNINSSFEVENITEYTQENIKNHTKEQSKEHKINSPIALELSDVDLNQLASILDVNATYSKVFGAWLLAHANDEKLVAVTPAMSEGSGMAEFAKKQPTKFIDVAIAEQHAVALSAGLAIGGLKPVCAIYSTFLQRAYDQFIHDLAIDDHDVLVAVDRAGIVGEDGQTHQGEFDISYLRAIPNARIWTPSHVEQMLKHLEIGYQAPNLNVVRYPRDKVITRNELTSLFAQALEQYGNLSYDDERLVEFNFNDNLALYKHFLYTPENAQILYVSFGTMLKRIIASAVKQKAVLFDAQHIAKDVFALVADYLKDHREIKFVVTFEENVIAGGAGSALSEYLIEQHNFIPVFKVGIDNRFIEPMESMLIEEQMGWTQPQIDFYVESKKALFN